MRAQLPRHQGRIAHESFVVRYGDGKTKEQLLSMGQYAHIEPMAEQFVRSDQFRMSNKFGEREFVVVDFDHYASTQEVLDFFVANKLEEPTEEDALRFALQFPPRTVDRPFVFLHTINLWMTATNSIEGEEPHVLVFGNRRLKKALYCRPLPGGRDHNENNWPTSYRFVARKPRRKK